MSIIDIDRMYSEMKNTMECNFQGTTEERFNQAKKLFLKSVTECINANKKDLIQEVKQNG